MTSWESEDDDRLLTAAAGNAGAFTAFYRRSERPMLAFFFRRTRDAELAADLTSEVFAAVLIACHRYRPGKAPAKAWLFAIAQHKLASRRRRSGGRAQTCEPRSIPASRSTARGADMTVLPQLERELIAAHKRRAVRSWQRLFSLDRVAAAVAVAVGIAVVAVVALGHRHAEPRSAGASGRSDREGAASRPERSARVCHSLRVIRE